MNQFDQFIDSLQDDTKQLARTELKNLIRTAKQESSAFVRQQAENLERWTVMLANGDLSAQGYKKLVAKMDVLADLESIRLSVQAKAGAQRLAEGIQSMVVKGLFSLI